MTTVGSWTGWRPHDTGRSAYNIGRHTSVNIGSTSAFLIDRVDIRGAGRMAIEYVNASGSPLQLKHYVTDKETPTATFTSTEWYQIPDSSTSYTIAKTTGHNRYMIDFDVGSIGPATWFGTVGSNDGAWTSTGSLTVYVHLFTA